MSTEGASAVERTTMAASAARMGAKTEEFIVPGSQQIIAYPIENANNIQLTGTKQWNVSASLENPKSVIVGYKSYIRIRCRANLDNLGPIVDPPVLNTAVTIRDEAAALLFDNINLKVGGVKINTGDTSLNKHFKDRYFTNPAIKDDETSLYNFFGSDDRFAAAANTPPNPQTISGQAIANNKLFDIIYRLDHLPLFGELDAPIFGGLTISLELKTAATPGSLFFTGDLIVASPRLTVIDASLNLFVETLDDSTALLMEQAFATRGLVVQTDLWDSMEATEPLPVATKKYITSQIMLDTVPDVLGLALMTNATLFPGPTSYKLQHKYLSSWQNLESVRIVVPGHPDRYYDNLEWQNSKSQLLEELSNCIENSGQSTMRLGMRGTNTMNSDIFLGLSGTGMIWINYRNYANKHPHRTVPFRMKITLTFKDPANAALGVIAACRLVVCPKYRSRFLLSPMAGQTMKLL